MVKSTPTKEDTKSTKRQAKFPVPQNQSSHSSELQILQSYRLIGTSEMDELFSARDRLIDFSDKINHLKYTPIRKDIILHCSKIKLAGIAQLDFDTIEKMVKNRIQKMIKNKRIKKNWSQQDVKILIWIVSKYAQHSEVNNVDKELSSTDWEYIGSLIPGVQSEHCMFKWLSLKKNNLSQNNWSDRESNLLDKIVKKFGEKDWVLISQQLYYANNSVNKTYRCPKQCREHWNCYLNPKLKKGPWSKTEDLLLLNCVKSNNGSKKWAQMIELVNGRTQNALKNRFTLIMEKQAKACPMDEQKTQIQLINQYLERNYVEQFVCKAEQPQKLLQKNGNKNKKEKVEEIKKEKKPFSRKRQNLRSSTPLNKNIDYGLPYDQPLRQSRKKNKQIPVKIEESISQQPLIKQEDNLSLPHEQISQPQHNNYWFESENKIFEDESFLSPLTSCRIGQEMPELHKVRIIEITHDQIEHLKISMLSNTNHYVPCIIAENKLTKITY